MTIGYVLTSLVTSTAVLSNQRTPSLAIPDIYMATQLPIVPDDSAKAEQAFQKPALPRDCTFSESDWRALAPHWYPMAFSHEVKDRPYPPGYWMNVSWFTGSATGR